MTNLIRNTIIASGLVFVLMSASYILKNEFSSLKEVQYPTSIDNINEVSTFLSSNTSSSNDNFISVNKILEKSAFISISIDSSYKAETNGFKIEVIDNKQNIVYSQNHISEDSKITLELPTYINEGFYQIQSRNLDSDGSVTKQVLKSNIYVQDSETKNNKVVPSFSNNVMDGKFYISNQDGTPLKNKMIRYSIIGTKGNNYRHTRTDKNGYATIPEVENNIDQIKELAIAIKISEEDYKERILLNLDSEEVSVNSKIQFQSEFGNIYTNIDNNFSIVAHDDLGNPIEVEGVIVDEQGNVLLEVTKDNPAVLNTESTDLRFFFTKPWNGKVLKIENIRNPQDDGLDLDSLNNHIVS